MQRWIALALVGLAGCGDGEMVTGDAQVDASSTFDGGATDAARDEAGFVDAARGDGAVCDPTACSDGQYCNGIETCVNGACAPGTPPCARMCDEAMDRCNIACADADGDGAFDTACGGNDCDDADPRRFPGASEACNQVDEDCNPETLGSNGDVDRDGFTSSLCCNPQDSGTVLCGTDCDDAMPNVLPGGTESCNRVDDDCNGIIDDGDVQMTFYRDVDSDMYGTTAMTMRGCSLPAGGWAFQPGDCNDMNANVKPDAVEVCNTIDDNCDGTTDPGCACMPGTMRMCGAMRADMPAMFESRGTCRAGMQRCNSSGQWDLCVGDIRPMTELCDMRDEDCNGVVDNGVDVRCYTDADGDTYAPMGASPQSRCPVSDRPSVMGCPLGTTNRAPTAGMIDCRDEAGFAFMRPGASEMCNGLDDNCDGVTDEGVKTRFYRDVDNDGYGTPSMSMEACSAPMGYVVNSTDCNDANAMINPAAVEQCAPPGVDEDCNPATTPTCACTFMGTQACAETRGVCAMGTQTCTSGVLSACSTQTVESCNTQDDDCDGMIDEGTQGTTRCYRDNDRDGYAPMNATFVAPCGAPCPPQTTTRVPMGPDIDCDDLSNTRFPGASELCNRLDDNCSGDNGSAEDVDNDGFASRTATCMGGALPKTDCDDASADARPTQNLYFFCQIGQTLSGTTCTGTGRGWDYDCSGAPSPADNEQVACERNGDVCLQSGGFWVGAAPPPCGMTYPYLRCVPGDGQTCDTEPSGGSGAQRCR